MWRSNICYITWKCYVTIYAILHTMKDQLLKFVYLDVIFLTLVGKAISMSQKNVFGNSLQPCSTNPMTGWFRDGYCRTDAQDHGLHSVCATMTKEFLEYTKSKGNDLSSPKANFPGLRPGDSWCLCAARWAEAKRAGVAPTVKLEATNEVSLRSGLQIQSLQEHAMQDNNSSSAVDSIADGSCNSDSDLCER